MENEVGLLEGLALIKGAIAMRNHLYPPDGDTVSPDFVMAFKKGLEAYQLTIANTESKVQEPQ